ncbi:hypothetical protein FQA39_LY05368 [Lamprigera yunnana]|nr:hypothetical protein FQA39_LY05368 [Lamprigera yunnana]
MFTCAIPSTNCRRTRIAELKKRFDDEFSNSSYDCSINNDNREYTVFTSIKNLNLPDIPVKLQGYSGDKLSDLYIEQEEPQESFDFTENRIVDIQYIFKSLQSLKHEDFNCIFFGLEIINERRLGFRSTFRRK